MQPIRTASILTARIIIYAVERAPLYKKLAQKIEELYRLKIPLNKIERTLKVSKKAIYDAKRYYEEIMPAQ